MSRRLILLCCVLLLALAPAAPAVAQAPTLVIPDIPKLSVTLDPTDAIESGGYVQGQLLLKVQIASRFPFEALDLDLPEIENAEVIEVQRPRTREVRSYAGNGYVFERTLALFPKTSGPLEIPSVSATGAIENDAGEEQAFAEHSDAMTIEIAGVDPRFSDPWWLVSDLVVLNESWTKPIDAWREGDIIRRKVTATVVGVTAAHIPEIEQSPIRGVTVAEAERTAETELTGKGPLATVKYSWDLKIETGSVLYIKPLRLVYWHPGERVEKVAALPGTRVEPLPPDVPALAATLLLEARQDFDQRRNVLTVLIVLALSPLLVVLLAFLYIAWPTRADRALRRACAANPSSKELYRAVSAWAAASDMADSGAILARTKSVSRTAFSAVAENVEPPALARALIKSARETRLKRLWGRRHRLTDWLLGPRVHLDGRARRTL